MRFLWLLPIVFAIWKMVSAALVLRVHRDDADDKPVFIPTNDPANPLLASAGVVRRRARRTRVRWMGVWLLSIAALVGLLTSPVAFVCAAAWYVVWKALG